MAYTYDPIAHPLRYKRDAATGEILGIVDHVGNDVLIVGIPALGGVAVVADSISSARANATAINVALAATGMVHLSTPGEIYVDSPVVAPSSSFFSVGPATVLKLVPNAGCAIIKNRDAQNALPVSDLAIVGSVATFTEMGHTKMVGESVYIEGALTNTTLNGVKTVTAVSAATWSFAGSGSLPTNTNEQRLMVSVYNPIAGASFVRTSNVVTVTESGHLRQVGDHIYITGLATTNFNGKAVVTTAIPGVSWTYASTGSNGSPTGTANVLGNSGIRLDLRYDGNRLNQSGLDEWLDFPAQFVNVGNMHVTAPEIRNYWWRGLGFWNAGQIDVPLCRFYKGSVGIQFDAACDGIRVGKALGQEMSDDVVAWGVTGQSGLFGETSSPSGPGNMGTLTVDEIDGDSPTGLFKWYCETGYDLGEVSIRTLRGAGRGVASDNSTGVSGGTAKRLHIGEFLAGPSVVGQSGINFSGLASIGQVIIDRSVDNYSADNLVFFLNALAPIGSLRLNRHTSLTYTAGTYPGIQINSGCTVDDMYVSGRLSCGTNGSGVAAINCASGGRIRRLVLDKVDAHGAGANASGTYSGRLVMEAAGGRIDKLVLRDVTCNDGQLDCIASLGSTTATDLDIIGFSQGTTDGTTNGRAASIINDNSAAKPINVFAAGLRVRNVPNNVFQFSGSGANVIRGSGIDIPAGKFALLTSGTHTTRIDCPEARIDMGANAGSPPARLSPTAGDRVYNTNATGGGHYVRTAAGAWQLVA